MHVASLRDQMNWPTRRQIPINMRLNSLVAQCKIYEFQLGDAEYEITITALTNYVHIPDGVFLVMMQATREQQ